MRGRAGQPLCGGRRTQGTRGVRGSPCSLQGGLTGLQSSVFSLLALLKGLLLGSRGDERRCFSFCCCAESVPTPPSLCLFSAVLVSHGWARNIPHRSVKIVVVVIVVSSSSSDSPEGKILDKNHILETRFCFHKLK